ncbi:MAG: 6-pyruvoyltetrahydropterin/6-carboxytetrahydropterin synthase [Pirellulaceae bacterium]|jgi:6-pyruvoyltetrahydropterin/6-carboxytetrahydropterin synthase
MAESFRVRLDKEYHVFSAAHFITFNGDICERIHGHNYGVFAEVTGELDENQYVIDFIALRDKLKRLTDQLDHHVILPANHETIKVVQNEKEVAVTFQDRRWIFPLEDCVILPVVNTTAEEIARYVGKKLLADLGPQIVSSLRSIEIGIDENNGQWGIWRQEPVTG